MNVNNDRARHAKSCRVYFQSLCTDIHTSLWTIAWKLLFNGLQRGSPSKIESSLRCNDIKFLFVPGDAFQESGCSRANHKPSTSSRRPFGQWRGCRDYKTSNGNELFVLNGREERWVKPNRVRGYYERWKSDFKYKFRLTEQVSHRATAFSCRWRRFKSRTGPAERTLALNDPKKFENVGFCAGRD